MKFGQLTELRRNVLLVTRYSLLVTFTCYSLLLLVTRCFLLVTCYFFFVTRYFLLVIHCYFLVARCYLLGTHYVLLAQYYIIFTIFTLNYPSVPERENASPNGCFSLVSRYCLLWVDLIVLKLDLQIIINE